MIHVFFRFRPQVHRPHDLIVHGVERFTSFIIGMLVSDNLTGVRHVQNEMQRILVKVCNELLRGFKQFVEQVVLHVRRRRVGILQ